MMGELPDTEFRPHWDQMLLERMTKVISGELGITGSADPKPGPRREARLATSQLIHHGVEFGSHRVRVLSLADVWMS
jgi:hypothetical protein